MKTLFYIPNIIGYLRILLLFIAYNAQEANYGLFAVSYFFSFCLDALDGIAARAFNQCSKFGAILDMLTDRVATLMLTFIAVQTPGANYKWALVSFGCVDIASHWLQYIASMFKNVHHKENRNKFRLLDIYYGSKLIMAPLCVGAELYLLAYIYLYTYNNASIGFMAFYLVVALLAYFKMFLNVLQLINGAWFIIEMEDNEREKATTKVK